MKTYGRKTIYANYTESELLVPETEKVYQIVVDILKNSVDIHKNNKAETLYLREYYNGVQDIYSEKKKITRPEIDNKTVENWAYAFVDFKKSWLLGKPIQYSLQGSESSNEITALNNYCSYKQKEAKDQMLFEDVLVSGRAFRYVTPIENDESPFDLINVDPEDCEVVYSSALGHEQLLSYIEVSKHYIYTDEEGKEEERFYEDYTVYTRNRILTVSNKSGVFVVIKDKPNIINEHRISEYYLNKGRISLIEIGKDLFNDINYLESLDKDDMEQFVNAIMVFQNAEVTEQDIEDIRRLGAVMIESIDGKEVKVTLLEQRLNANTTATYYSRLLNALHQILGVPKSGDNGDVSYGDTGQARLTGQGYTSAGIRADSDETMFEMCDFNSLKTILKICREKSEDIKGLKAIQVKANFQRNMSDNLLVKAQAIQTLYSAKVPREIVNTIVGLFPDPNVVTRLQEKIFGSESELQQENKQDFKNIQEQNNKLQDINEKSKQGV